MTSEEFAKLSSEEKTKELMKLYDQLTPENKAKARAKYLELLAEQEADA